MSKQTSKQASKSKPDKPVAHVIRLEHWYDDKLEAWRAKLIWTEERQGRQYGGAATSEFTARPGIEHKQMMQIMRHKVREDLSTYWT